MANKGKYLKLTCQKKDNNNRKTGDESISEPGSSQRQAQERVPMLRMSQCR